MSTRRRLAAAALIAGAALVAVLLVATPWQGDGGERPPGFVYRDGSRLYLDGEPYRFVGVNMPWPNNRQPGGCGPPVTVAPLEKALDRVSRSVNAARVWFFQSQATVDGARDWTAFDETLRAIAERDLKVIVTLADQAGSCADPGGFKDIDWYESGYANAVSPGFPQTYRDYVRDVVARYADRPEVLAWQLINEASVDTPGVGCADERAAAEILRRWTDDMAGLVRAIDPNHLISLGTGLQGGCGYAVDDDPTRSSYRYVHASPEVDLCEYHDYNVAEVPLFVLQQQEMDTCADLGKAFFVGEIGIPSADPRRPELLDAKLAAQFGHENPSQGALVWHLGGPAVGMCDQYCLGARDPVLDVLERYRDGD